MIAKAQQNTINVGIFNLSKSGVNTRLDSKLLDSLCKILTQYDILAVQGFSASKASLSDAINTNRLGEYRSLLNGKYLYLYNARKVSHIPEVKVSDTSSLSISTISLQTGLLYDIKNKIQKDPFLAVFTTDNGSYVTFLNIDVNSKNAYAEIKESLKGMGELYKNQEKHDAFKNIMLMGALSGDCEYITPTHKYYLQMDFPLWHWVLDDQYDTTVDGKNCTYDNAIASADLVANIKKTGVDKRATAKSLSDHYPVFFNIKL